MIRHDSGALLRTLGPLSADVRVIVRIDREERTLSLPPDSGPATLTLAARGSSRTACIDPAPGAWVEFEVIERLTAR